MPIPSKGSLKRGLLRDDVYERIRDAIVDGTLSPGEQVRDIEVAAWLGVSRTPVREALLRLGAAGLVTSAPGRSTTVAPIETKTIRDAQSVVASMHRLAVELAVPTLTADDLAAMREANQRFARALDRHDADAALAADDVFHAIPVAAAANEAINTVLDQFTPVVRRLERLRFGSLLGRDSVDLHAKLVDLCEAGDVANAAEVSHATWQSLIPLLGDVETDATPAATSDSHGKAVS